MAIKRIFGLIIILAIVLISVGGCARTESTNGNKASHTPVDVSDTEQNKEQSQEQNKEQTQEQNKEQTQEQNKDKEQQPVEWKPSMEVPFDQYVFTDLGNVPTPGSCEIRGDGTITITTTGKDLTGIADSASFIGQRVEGTHYQVTVRIVSRIEENDRADIGIMIRDSLDKGAKKVMFGMSGQNTSLQWRNFTNGKVDIVNKGIDLEQEGSIWADTVPQDDKEAKPKYVLPIWIRLVREGNVIRGYVSRDGKQWILKIQGVAKVSDSAYVGLAVSVGTNKPDGTENIVAFDNFRIEK